MAGIEFLELLELCFRGRLIRSIDHPALERSQVKCESCSRSISAKYGSATSSSGAVHRANGHNRIASSPASIVPVNFSVWADDLSSMERPPFHIGDDSLFVAYFAPPNWVASALGWPSPVRVLDLFTEFRCLTNGRETPCGNSLLGALAYFGISGIEAAEKRRAASLGALRRTIYRNGKGWTPRLL